MPMGRRIHHVRFETHRKRIQMVTVQCSKLPSFLKVSADSSPPTFSCENLLHFSGDTASCLHNAPHEDEALGRQLPGTLLSLDAQCRRDRGTSACFKDERVCAQLFCFDAASGYCVAYRPAAEGSSCGDGHVSSIENISTKLF
jgi:ADAM cysteine-rich domain